MATEPTPRPARRVRWVPGVVLLALSPFAIVGAWFAAGALADDDRFVQMWAAIATLSAAFLVQLVWWLGLSRLSWRGKAIGAAAVLVAAGVAAAPFRIDTFRGEMLPVVVPRWWPTPEEKALAYFDTAKSKAAAPTGETAGSIEVTEGDWPEYRGSGRDGIESDAAIRTNWAVSPPTQVWRHEVGPGWSSFAVVGDRLYTQEQRGEDEVVVCYDAATGGQIWTHADKARFSETLGGDGPRATPTVADGAVYSLGATGILNRLDAAAGSVVWSRDILKDAGDGERVENIAWGMAGSPLLREGKIYVAPGGGKGRGVIAYDAETGEIVWAKGDGPASYAAPRVETVAGEPTLLVVDGDAIKGYDPNDGALRWSYPWTNQPKVNASQPIVHDGKVFVGSGYAVGSVLLEPKRVGDGWKVDVVWRNDNEFKLKFNDPILHDGHLYGLDEGILACYEFATGERKWKKGRYGYGQAILLGDTLVILAEDGRLAAVKASPEKYEEVASFRAIAGKTWNHPAYARGFLYVRNDREAACFDVRPVQSTAAR